MPARSAASRFRRLGFESLETRNLLAGDVTAAVIDGDLVLTGDAGDNVILIRPGANPGEIQLIGVRDTTINGDPRSAVVLGMTDDILANMGGGNDRFVVTRLQAPSDLKVELGGGDNRVKLDRIDLPGSVHIDGGDDKDGILIRGASVGDELNVDLGDGENHFTMLNSGVDGETEILGGAQRDRLEMLRAAFDETLSIDLAGENDRVVVVRSSFVQAAAFQLGTGPDKMVLMLSQAEAAFDIDGSDGSDLFINTSNLFDNPPTIVNFETVT